MTKQSPPKKYTGALAKKLRGYGTEEFPVELINLYAATPSPVSDRLKEKVSEAIDAHCLGFTEERRAKLPALFSHFGIMANAPDSWRKLASSLAIKHVPGFQVENRKRPRLARAWFDFELWAEIKLIQLQGGHKIKPACEIYWKRSGRKGKASSTRRRFTAAQVELDPIFREFHDDILNGILSRAIQKLRRGRGQKPVSEKTK